MIGYIHTSAQDTYKMLRLKGLNHYEAVVEIAHKLRVSPGIIKEVIKC